MIETFAPSPDDLTPKDVSFLHQIMINAYAVTEEKIWGPNYARMSEAVFSSFIKRDELIVAKMNHTLVGSVRVYEEAPGVFNLSVFSVESELRGHNVGTKLVEASEQHALKKGGHKLTLEILRPQLFELDIKTRLAHWYKRMGYMHTESMLFEERKPDNIEKLKQLKIPVIFDCYEKVLNA